MSTSRGRCQHPKLWCIRSLHELMVHRYISNPSITLRLFNAELFRVSDLIKVDYLKVLSPHISTHRTIKAININHQPITSSRRDRTSFPCHDGTVAACASFEYVGKCEWTIMESGESSPQSAIRVRRRNEMCLLMQGDGGETATLALTITSQHKPLLRLLRQDFFRSYHQVMKWLAIPRMGGTIIVATDD